MNIFVLIGMAAVYMGKRPRKAILTVVGYILIVVMIRELYFIALGIKAVRGILLYISFILHIVPALSCLGVCLAYMFKYEPYDYRPEYCSIPLKPTPENIQYTIKQNEQIEKERLKVEKYRKNNIIRFLLTDNSIPMAVIRAFILAVMIKNTPDIYKFLRYPTLTAEWFTRNYYIIVVVAINLYEFIVASCILGIWRTFTMKNYHKIVEVETEKQMKIEDDEKDKLREKKFAAFSPEGIAQRKELDKKRAIREIELRQNVWWAAISSWDIGIGKELSDEIAKCVAFDAFGSSIHHEYTWTKLFNIDGMSLENINNIINCYNRDFNTEITYLSVAEINVAMANTKNKLPANVNLIDYFPIQDSKI